MIGERGHSFAFNCTLPPFFVVTKGDYIDFDWPQEPQFCDAVLCNRTHARTLELSVTDQLYTSLAAQPLSVKEKEKAAYTGPFLHQRQHIYN